MISCKKSLFEVTNSEIKILSKTEILNLEITEKYINEFIVVSVKEKRYISDEESARTLRVKNPEAYQKLAYENISKKSLDDKGKEELNTSFREREAIDNKESKLKESYTNNTNIKGIKSYLELKNKTNEVIENGYLTVRITFKFKNKQYQYLKPFILLSNNKLWSPDETLNYNLNDIMTFAIGNTKTLDVHTPEKVKIEFYLTANNSVGYNIIDENKRKLVVSIPYNKDEMHYGKFTDKVLTDKEIIGLGQKILEKDITNLWNNKTQ